MTTKIQTDVAVTFECDKCHTKREVKAASIEDAKNSTPKEWKTLVVRIMSADSAFYESVSTDLCPLCYSGAARALGLDINRLTVEPKNKS